jgi:RimJ/RimL family protein N-acetyltransferase
MIYLDCLNFENVEHIRRQRNKISGHGIFRTSFLLTYNMQKEFYDNIISNRKANSRYFGIFLKEISDDMTNLAILIGYIGLDKIEWENGIAEIGLLIFDKYHNKGYGSKALNLLLIEAFNSMRLQNIYGECYKCNPGIKFWKKMIKKYKGYETILPARKFFNGSYWDSLYFNFNCFDFGE